jgi:hypothetical protein
MGRSAYPESEGRRRSCETVRARHSRHGGTRLPSRGMLDERERRRGHRGEGDQHRATSASGAARASVRRPRREHFVGRPETLERNARCVTRITTARDLVRDRVVEVVPELESEPHRSHAANVTRDRRQICLHLGHWLSTACTLAANCSQS